MTDLCTIGPVSITTAMLWDNNEFSTSTTGDKQLSSGTTIFSRGQALTSEGFSIICEHYQALQIKGLIEIGEPVYIDASTDLSDNDYFQHKGWYILTSIDFEHLNPAYMKCDIGCEKVSNSGYEDYLTMDYTTGVYDGIKLDYTYIPTTTTYQLQDDFSDASELEAVKEAEVDGGNPTTSGASDGAEIDIACASATDGNLSQAWMRTSDKMYPPFTLETVLDRNTLPAAGAYPFYIGFGMSKEDMPAGTTAALANSACYKTFGQWFRYEIVMSDVEEYDSIAVSRNGSWSTLSPSTSIGTTIVEVLLRIKVEANGICTVWTQDLTTPGSLTQRYHGPINIDNIDQGLYMYLYAANRDSTSKTASFQYLNVYNSDDTDPDYLVTMPYNATLSTTATGTRTGEDGNISYYTNPTTSLRFVSDSTNFYKGSVKLLSTNNTGANSRQVFSTDVWLTPATTILKNAFTKLEFDADEMIVYGYYGGQWNEIMDFDFGTAINIIKPLRISHDEVWLQVNDTKIHMTRSSPMISFYHPNTSVTYTLRNRYYHNGALTSSPGAAADIAMTDTDDGYYASIYNTASDTYQLVIGKKDPTTIKSDSLPADDITGIGWWEKTMTGVNTRDAIVRQWWKQTRTSVSWKQII